MGTIDFDAPADRNSPHHHCNLHTISDHGFGWLAMPPSTPFWIAVCRRVVDVFGGAVDYSDSDESEVDYFRFESPLNAVDDGKDYYKRQQRLFDLRAVGAEEIEACRGFAAYRGMESYLPAVEEDMDAATG